MTSFLFFNPNLSLLFFKKFYFRDLEMVERQTTLQTLFPTEKTIVEVKN